MRELSSVSACLSVYSCAPSSFSYALRLYPLDQALSRKPTRLHAYTLPTPNTTRCKPATQSTPVCSASSHPQHNSTMPLDITLFRTEGGNPEIIRESQRRRYASVELVDEIIAQDAEWRLMTGSIDNLRKGRNAVQKEVGKKMKAKESCEELVAQIKILGEGITKAEADQKDLKTIIDKKVGSIGKREPITHTLSNYLTIYYLAI